ncbi:MAG: hypothetical protein R8G66_07110 [Cytophagales bacterium]|nr:hypothetical protein [Cytophagales bacterium]
MVKAVGIIRFLSFALFLIAMGLVYSYLSPQVELAMGPKAWVVSKDTFFYGILGIFVGVNVVLRVLSQNMKKGIGQSWDDKTLAWFLAIVPIINIYISLLVGFVGVINNPTHVSTSSYSYLIFFGPVLLVVWVIGFGTQFIKEKKAAIGS